MYKEIIEKYDAENNLKRKNEKRKAYHIANQFVKKGETVMVGSSLMELFPINEIMQGKGIAGCIYNRGICGYTTTELLDTMEECIFELEPSRIFINIGTNDIGSHEYEPSKLLDNYGEILHQIKIRLAESKVIVMAYYPVNPMDDFGLSEQDRSSMYKTRTNETITAANIEIERLSKKYGYDFINVNKGLYDHNSNLKKEYSIEGLHMWPNGYEVVFTNLIEYLLK